MSIESSDPIAVPPPGQIDQPGSAALDNSPVAYGLGYFGLSSTVKTLVGYFPFSCVDVLGLVVALAAFVKVVYAIWDAMNDPLFGYLSGNTRPGGFTAEFQRNFFDESIPLFPIWWLPCCWRGRFSLKQMRILPRSNY